MMPILQICFDYSGNEENARMHRFRPRSYTHGPLARMLSYECTKAERDLLDTIRITINDQDSGAWRVPSDFVARQEARYRHAEFLYDTGMLEDNVPDILGTRTGRCRIHDQVDRPQHWMTVSPTPPPRVMGDPNHPANLSNFVSPQVQTSESGGVVIHIHAAQPAVPPPPPLPVAKRPPPRRPPERTPEYRSSPTERVD